MKRFLEKRDSNILTVATYLVSQHKDSFLLGEITRATPINRRTLINLIDEYNSLEFDQSGLFLNYDLEQLNVMITPDFTTNRLSRLLLRKSLLFNLCDAIFNETFTTLSDFTNDNFISTSSMYRRQEKLRQVLADFSIKLDFTNANILIGEEKQIRHFYYELYNQAYELSAEDKFPLLPASPFVSAELEHYFSHLPVPTFKKIKLVTIVFYTRLKQGHYLLEDELNFNSYNINDMDDKLNDFMGNLIDYLEQPMINKGMEIRFFSFYIQTIDLIALEHFDAINSYYPDFDNPHVLIASRWISELALFINISLSTTDYFFLLINLYHHSCRNDVFHGASLFDDFITNNLKANDPYIYKKAESFLIHITNKQFPRSNSLDSIYYLLIKEVILNSKIAINVCVFSSLFQSQKAAIERKLYRLSTINIHFQDYVTTETDLVISDFTNSTKIKLHHTIPWFMINSFPSNDEYERVILEISAIYDHKLSLPHSDLQKKEIEK